MEKSALIIFLIFVFAQIQGDEKSYNFDLYTLDDVYARQIRQNIVSKRKTP